MLGFPQPSDSELVESCPLVHLPDSAGEVTTFLKAIFDSGQALRLHQIISPLIYASDSFYPIHFQRISTPLPGLFGSRTSMKWDTSALVPLYIFHRCSRFSIPPRVLQPSHHHGTDRKSRRTKCASSSSLEKSMLSGSYRPPFIRCPRLPPRSARRFSTAPFTTAGPQH